MNNVINKTAQRKEQAEHIGRDIARSMPHLVRGVRVFTLDNETFRKFRIVVSDEVQVRGIQGITEKNFKRFVENAMIAAQSYLYGT